MRMLQPLVSHVPMLSVPGDHEIEPLPSEAVFTAYNARFPQPLAGGLSSAVKALNRSAYTNPNFPSQFIHSSTYTPGNSYWSLALPPVHVVALNNLVPFGVGSTQWRWLKKTLATKVNRAKTPWLVVLLHAAPYTTNAKHFREMDSLLAAMEPLFRAGGVDLVLSGHVHAYERAGPVYNYTVDPCSTRYVSGGLPRRVILRSSPPAPARRPFHSPHPPLPQSATEVIFRVWISIMWIFHRPATVQMCRSMNSRATSQPRRARR